MLVEFEPNDCMNLPIDLNVFLLETAVPVIKYLQDARFDLPEHFSQVCLSNKTYLSSLSACPLNQIDPVQEEIFRIVTSTLQEFSVISEYTDCSCHADRRPCKSTALEVLKKYLNQLSLILNDCRLVDTAINSDFKADYQGVLEDLLRQKITLQEAQTNLLFWKDAIAEDLLQGYLRKLTYSYINSLMSRKF